VPVRAPVGFEALAGELAREGILVGPGLAGAAPWLGPRHGLVAVTEVHSKRHIDLLASKIGEVLGRVQAG